MKTVQLTMEDDLHARLKEAAWEAKMTLGNYLRSMLDEHLPKAHESSREANND